jgi:hypothetical protein
MSDNDFAFLVWCLLVSGVSLTIIFIGEEYFGDYND